MIHLWLVSSYYNILFSNFRGCSQTTFTRFVFFWPITPLRLHFLWYKSLQEVDFFDHLPPSSCKRSLWTTPNLKYSHVISGFTVHRLVNWRGHKASTLVGGFQGKQDGYHCTAAAPHRVPGDTILFKKSKSRLWLNNKEHVQNQKITWNLS